MTPTPDPTLYAALVARDHRFDGRCFVGVTSTGIYCRFVCSVRTPKAANCRFFTHPAQAESGGFRPCLRCRPELAPGLAAIDAPSRLAWAAAQRIEAGDLDDQGLAGLATRLGITDRHLRRVFHDAFGVTPVDYAQTQRLLMAKRLLADTALPVTEVALAAGFGSLRRFNALFRQRYGLTPSILRRATPAAAAATDREAGLRFELAYRPPLDWPGLLDFLAQRCIRGVDSVLPADSTRASAGTYRRSLRLSSQGRTHAGWLSVTPAPAGRHTVMVQVSAGLQRVLPAVLAGVRRLCDLSCDPEAVNGTLGPLAAGAPGLRVPGAVDGFEMAVRAVLGQQITVKAAHTLAGRLAARFGTPIDTPFDGVDTLFPTAATLAEADPAELAALGIVSSRARTLVGLARAVVLDGLDLGPAADVEAAMARLQALPGIGAWTAGYIAMRALGWPDAWPQGDVVLRRALGGVSAAEADRRALAWRPWRSYAALHLWRQAGTPRNPDPDKSPQGA